MPTIPFVRRVDVLAVDLELFVRLFAGVAGERPRRHAVEQRAELQVHVREPFRISVGVGVEVIKEDVLHFVVALGVGQRVVGLAQMPFAREEALPYPL